jgi:hypothetical protein
VILKEARVEGPVLYKGEEPVQWKLSQVLHLCRLAIEQGVADELANEGDAQGHRVMIPKEAVNFAKRFLFDRAQLRSRDEFKAIVECIHCGTWPPRPDPFPRDPDGGTN